MITPQLSVLEHNMCAEVFFRRLRPLCKELGCDIRWDDERECVIWPNSCTKACRKEALIMAGLLNP